MTDDQLLFDRFHAALDVDLTSGAYERLRTKLIAARVRPPRRPWLTIVLPRLSPRVVALAVAVILVLAATAVFIGLHEFAHRVIETKPAPGSGVRLCGSTAGPEMVTDKIGWNGTQRTTDGGLSWRDVSPQPPSSAVKGGYATCLFDANHAWVVQAVGTTPYQPTGFVVSATSDGGQTWQNGQAIPVEVRMTLQGNYDLAMTFLDDQHGWIVFDTGTTSTPNYLRTVYATSDGGFTWKRLVTTAKGGGKALASLDLGCDETAITFTSLSRGWLSFGCGSGSIPANPPAVPPVGPALLVTHDGGRTWSPATMASGCDDVGAPVFSGNDGVVPLICGTGAYLRTTDGGATWTAVALPVSAPNTVQFVNGDTGYLIHVNNASGTTTSNDLYRTDDGGTTWRIVAKALFAGQPITQFQFVDTQTGYISAPPGPWWTHDGGVTWTPPPGTRSVGTTICALPQPPSYPPFATLQMFTPTVGWASGAWRTSDGGAHWSSVAPPPVADREQGYGEFFLDADRAWVAESAGSGTACVDRVVVLATSDGGASWERVATIKNLLPALGPATTGDWNLSIDFVDPVHGWLWVQPRPRGSLQAFVGSGSHSPSSVLESAPAASGALFRSDDGGHHWVTATPPVEGSNGCSLDGLQIGVTSLTTAWFGAFCGGNETAFFVTHDGGQTWAVQVVDATNCCAATRPTFFDSLNGWLLESSGTSYLVTSDGGQTWAAGRVPHITYHTCYRGAFASWLGSAPEAPPPGPYPCSDTSIAAITLLNPTTGLAVMLYAPDPTHVAWYVERTVDGGRAWRVISARMPAAISFECQSLEFVTTNNGFCWDGASTIFVTSDGGRTWSATRIEYQ